ncbi:MAG: hypothetical protein V4669_13590 [Pseudomonadota bacterium]
MKIFAMALMIAPTICLAASPSKALSTRAVAAVKLKLTDPDSAKFEGLRLGNSPANNVVCGLVNAKNQLGGYAGRKVFYYFDAKPPIVVVQGDASMEHTIPVMCPGFATP